MAFGYRQVKDIYDSLAEAGVVTQSLPEWSQEMNDKLGTDLYSAGLEDNFIKRASVGVDRLLEKTGLPQAGEEFGKGFGRVFGDETAGAEIGRGLARGALNVLPMLIPGVGPAAGAARFAGQAALAGAEAYTATGEPMAGVIGGVTAGIMPGAAHLAEQAVLKRMGGELVEGVSRYFPKTIPQGIASQAAGQLAAAGLGVGSEVGQQVAAGQPISISPTEQLLNLTLGQAPFAGMYLTKGGRVPWGGEATRAHIAELQSRAHAGELDHAIELTKGLQDYNAKQAEIKAKPGMEEIVDPPKAPETDLNAIRLKTAELEKEGSTLGQEEQDKLAKTEKEVVNLEGPQLGQIFGAQLGPDVPRTKVVGDVVGEGPGWRMIRASDDPGNGEFAGKQIHWDTRGEPVSVAGEHNVPEGYWSEYHNVGDTPVVDHGRALTEAEQQLSAAKSGADVQAAVVKLNGVRQQRGLEALDDVGIAKVLENAGVGDERAAVKSVINETRRVIGAEDEAAAVNGLRAQQDQLSEQLETAPPEMVAGIQAQIDALGAKIGRQEPPKTVGYVGKSYELSKQSKRIAAEFPGLYETLVPVTVDVAKLDVAHGKAFPAERVGLGGEGGDVARYQRFGRWVESRQPMEMPIMKLDENGQPQFIRGRHRFAVLRDKGQKTVDVTIPRDQAEKFLATFGPEGKPTKEAIVKADVAKIEKLPVGDSAATKPLEQLAVEKAIKITQGTEFVEDGAKFVEFVRDGMEPFMKKYGLDWEGWMAWVGQPHVAVWAADQAGMDRSRLPPGFENEVAFAPKSAVDQEFVSRMGSNGREAVAALMQSQDPTMRALAKDLSRHETALEKIGIVINETDAPSRAHRLGDGRAQITLAASLRKDRPVAQEAILMHELLHGLTMEQLKDPLNAGHVAALEGLRQNVLKGLPERLRTVMEKVGKDQWFERWARGDARWDEYKDDLGGSTRDMQTIYGLLTNDEFISQGFTSPEFRNYLRSVKGTGGENLYHKFINWVSDLVGLDIKGSAFEELLHHTDKIIGDGNYVASIREYGERYFQNKGLEPDFAKAQTDRGLAVARYRQEPGEMVNRLVRDEVNSPEMVKTTADLRKLLLEDPAPTGRIMTELKYSPDEAGLTQMAGDMLLGKIDKDAMTVLDPRAAAYVYAKARDVQEVLGMVHDATGEEVRGLVNVEDPQGVRAPVEETLGNAKKVLKLEDEFVKATADVQGLNGLSPMGFKEAEMSRPAPNMADPPEVNTPAKKMAWWQKLFQLPSFLSKASEEGKELNSRAMMLEQNAKKMKLQALQAIGLGPDGKFSKDALKPFSDNVVERAASKWMYANYKKGSEGDGIVHLGRDDAEVRAILNGVPEAKRGQVEQVATKMVQAGQVQQEQIMNKMTDIAVINGGALISKTGLKLSQNMETAKRMLDLQAVDVSDPRMQMEYQARLAALQQELAGTPGAFDLLLEYSKNQAESLNLQREFNAKNPAWTTTRRFGLYDLEYRKGNKVIFDRVNSKKEADFVRGGNELIRFERSKDNEDTPVTFKVTDLSRLEAIEAKNIAMLEGELGPEAADEMRRHSITEQLKREMYYDQTDRGLARQVDTLGRGEEEMSFVRNHINWIDKSSSYWTRELLRTQARAMLASSEMKQRPDLQDGWKQHIQNMLNPDPTVASGIRRVLSTWYLGLSPATAAVNGTQLLTRGMAEMTMINGGKIVKGYRQMLGAMKEATGLSKPKAELAEERNWLWKQVKEDGIATAYNEGDPANDGMDALQQALARGRPQGRGQQLGEINKGVSEKALWLFKQMERINNNGAILAAFDHYMDEGGVRALKGEEYVRGRNEAYEKAKGFNQTVNDVGGKANRPIGLFSGKDVFSKSAAMLGTAMQTYNIGSINQIANYVRRGFFDPPGLMPGEKHGARMALVQLMASQVVLAGVLGLPGASGALAVVNQAFPELEVNKNVRKWINQIFAGDAENGNVISDVAMSGIPSMFGWDLQSRLSMGNMLPGVSEFNGFQPEAVAGPAVNLGAQFFKGVSQLITGQPGEALVTLMPPAAKKFVNLASDGFKIRDYNNKPVFDPTGGEVVGMALGFQPKRLSDWNAAQRVALSAEKMEDEREKTFRQDIANQMLKGRMDVVRQTLRQRVHDDPEFDWEKAAKSAAKAAVELQFPRDLRREGSGSEEYAKVLRLYNLDATLPSETARKQFEAKMLGNFGLRIDSRSIRKAQEMDALRAQNPRMTRYELQRMVEASEKRRSVLPAEAVPL